MRNLSTLVFAGVLLFLSALINQPLHAQTRSTIKGIVFHDKNENGIYDSADKPLKDVRYQTAGRWR
jgi:hypothetical protein